MMTWEQIYLKEAGPVVTLDNAQKPSIDGF